MTPARSRWNVARYRRQFRPRHRSPADCRWLRPGSRTGGRRPRSRSRSPAIRRRTAGHRGHRPRPPPRPRLIPAWRSVPIISTSFWISSLIRWMTTRTGAAAAGSDDHVQLLVAGPEVLRRPATPSSARPGIGLPYGDSVGAFSRSTSLRSTSSEMTCSHRQASSWTFSQSSPITSINSRSASRCLRITRVARVRPSAVSSRCRSPCTCTRLSRSIRATVCDTVGPLWCSRSAIRARSGTMPSSSSSKMVRRYISVVSIRSLTLYFSLLRGCRPGRQPAPSAAPCKIRTWLHHPAPRSGGCVATSGSRDNPALRAAPSTTVRPCCRCSCSTRPCSRTAGTARRAWLLAALHAAGRRTARCRRPRLSVVRGRPCRRCRGPRRRSAPRPVHIAADFGPYGRAPRRARRRRSGRARLGAGPDRIPVRGGPGHADQQVGQSVPGLHPVPPRLAGTRRARPGPGRPGRSVDWIAAENRVDIPAADADLVSGRREGRTRRSWRELLARDREGVSDYPKHHDFPGADATSHLSIALRWGHIHPRTVLKDLAQSAPRGARPWPARSPGGTSSPTCSGTGRTR